MAGNGSFAQSLGDKACRNEGEGVRYHVNKAGELALVYGSMCCMSVIILL